MALRPKIKNSDGTLTDLPIAAETAVKLKTSRSIGLSGVSATARSFDGTSAITIPITAIPGSLLSGTTAINTSGNAETATKLSNSWTEFIPGSTVLPYGTYLIKVEVCDATSGIGNYGTTITDIIGMLIDSYEEYEYRGYDYPSGPLHIYVSNNYEAPLYKMARIRVQSYTTEGFRLNLYICNSGGYALSSSDITGNHLYPEKVASTITGISYKMRYRRIM